MSKLLDSLLPCPCGNQAELHEWEERDATRWAARATCNCGWEGPIGYADNHRGCFDAVNDLHKKRAIAKWNKRPAKEEGKDAVAQPIGWLVRGEQTHLYFDAPNKPGFVYINGADKVVSIEPRYSEHVGQGALAALEEIREMIVDHKEGVK